MTDQHQLSLTFLSGDPNEAWDIGCWECIWYAFGYAAQSNITARAQSDHVTITFQDDHVRTWQDTQHVLVLASLQSSPNTLVEGHSIVSCCRQQIFENKSHKDFACDQRPNYHCQDQSHMSIKDLYCTYSADIGITTDTTSNISST